MIIKLSKVFLLFFCPIFLGCYDDSTKNEKAITKTTSLRFDKSSYDFGDVKTGQTVRHNFRFVNTGKIPLIINEVSSSCGCTIPSWPKRAIKPDSVGYITVEYTNKNDPGTHIKMVIIKANIPDSYHVLKIRAIVH